VSATFEHQDLRDADFDRQDLTGCRFVNCRISGASFRGADMVGAYFEGCAGWEANAKGATADTGVDFSFADLREAGFVRCDLSLARLVRIRGYDLTMEHCQLQGADLSHADFALPIATREPPVAAVLRHCNLSHADLSHVDLTGADLSGSRLMEALLHETCLRRADLSGTDLNNVSGRGMILAGADLRNAAFNGLDPRLVDLTGVRITSGQAPMLLGALGIILSD